MKRLFFVLIILAFIANDLIAQSPQAFKYQAIVRNASGNILINQTVRFRLSILQGSVGGSSVYVETQYTTTNSFGMVDLAIGNGTYVSGNFSTISWGTSTFFLKVELDPSGGTSYTTMGTTQLLSVPYALYAGSAGGNLWSPNGNNIFNNNPGNVGIGTNTPTSKLVIKQTTTNINDTLFIVKDNAGNTVFAVFPQGVRVYVPDLVTGTVGGFAVTGRTSTKGSGNYLIVNHDSTRIYTNDNSKGFGIGNISGGVSQSYMKLTPFNYFIGHQTGENSTGNYNLFLGYQAGRYNTTGYSNVFLGFRSGYYNSIGYKNIFIGDSTGFNNSGSAVRNVFIGNLTGYNNYDGDCNVYIGDKTAFSNTNGYCNVILGQTAAYNNTGNFNTIIGYMAGYSNTGSGNVFIGNRAGQDETGSNKLYINNGGGIPLIYGDLSANTVGINNISPTQTLDVSGNARFRSIGSGAWSGWLSYMADGTLTTSTSDIRLKENIEPLQNSLEKVLKLQGINYTWKNDSLHIKKIGFIAQDMEKVFPEFVFTNSVDGYKGINYPDITAVLAEAIKEQQKQIELLKSENENLKKDNTLLNIKVCEIDKLSAEIENLKTILGITSK